MSSRLFTDFGLSAEMMKAIERLGFEQPAPIQAESLPPLMEGKDVVGQSQTGSGKTAAFAIPAIERMVPADRFPQVLILCPTRELAVQVSEEVHKLAHFKPGVRPLPIYGGQSYDRQFLGLRSGANIIIGTPGRVMDHMNRGSLKLDGIRTVVLDEADEMLNMGFRDDIEFILKAVPQERQTVLFSATIPRAIQELINHHTRNPVHVKIEGKALTVPTVEQVYVEVDRRRKMEALERLIDMHDASRGIVFCNTQRMVDDLAEHMNAAGYSTDSIHGGMAQGARDRAMKKFRTGGVEFLVATDVAARGIDVDDIQVVFNYDLPYDGEDYVHRIGRTGRAGRAGLAISFASGKDLFQIRQIERYTRQRMRRADVPTAGEIEEARVNSLVKRVRQTMEAGDFRHYDRIIEGLLEEGVDSMDLMNALFHHLSGAATAAEAEVAKPAAPQMRGLGGGLRPVPAGGASPGAARPSTPPAPAAEVPAAPEVPIAPAPAKPAPAPVPETPAAPTPPLRPAPRAEARPARPERPRREPPAPRGEDRAPGRFQAKPWERKVPGKFGPPHRRDGGEPRARAYGAPGAAPYGAPRAPRPGAYNRDYQGQGQGGPMERPRKPFPRPHGGPMTRLWLSVGLEHGISAGNIKGCILGETGAPPETVGKIDLRERHSFVEVSTPAVGAVLPKLNRAHLGGQRLKAKVA